MRKQILIKHQHEHQYQTLASITESLNGKIEMNCIGNTCCTQMLILIKFLIFDNETRVNMVRKKKYFLVKQKKTKSNIKF